MIIGKKLLYVLIFCGMGVNGFLYLSWFLSPPNPNRVGYWFWIYLFVFPYLGFLGIAALVLKNLLSISSSIGITLLLYVGILAILANSFQLGLGWMLGWLPYLGYEFVQLRVYFSLSFNNPLFKRLVASKIRRSHPKFRLSCLVG